MSYSVFQRQKLALDTAIAAAKKKRLTLCFFNSKFHNKSMISDMKQLDKLFGTV